MSVLYLVEQGSALQKRGDTLLVTKEGRVLAQVPAMTVEQVVVTGNVTLTTPALAYLLDRGVETVLLSVEGRYRGRLVPPESGYGALRAAQARVAADPAATLRLARRFVQGKRANQRTMLMRYHRERPRPEVAAAVEVLGGCLARLERVQGMGSLHGVEGTGSAAYFQAFRALLKQDLGFVARARRPPTDPVNAMLSFGYTLLLHNVQAALHTVGLDPYQGYLHALAYARPSLALDLMEEFRGILVDSVVLRLVNTLAVGPEHFSPTETGGIYLNEEGQRRFLPAFEERMAGKVL